MEEKVKELEGRIGELLIANAQFAAREVSTTPRRDLTLQNLIKPWAGDAVKDIPVEDFIRNIERAAKNGKWTEEDKVMVCEAKLTGAAATFVTACPDLKAEGTNFSDYSRKLKERFGETRDRESLEQDFHAAKQKKGEGVREFADRCSFLGLKTLSVYADTEEQEWAKKDLNRRILAVFIAGLKGEAARQLRYQPPGDLKDAVLRAERVERANQLDDKEATQTHVFEVAARERSDPGGVGAPSLNTPADVTMVNSQATGNRFVRGPQANAGWGQGPGGGARTTNGWGQGPGGGRRWSGAGRSGSNTRGSVRCYVCGADHLARECPRRVLVCYACNGLNHLMRDCPQRGREAAGNPQRPLRALPAPDSTATPYRAQTSPSGPSHPNAYHLTAAPLAGGPGLGQGTHMSRM